MEEDQNYQATGLKQEMVVMLLIRLSTSKWINPDWVVDDIPVAKLFSDRIIL
jgi:hypothetical protein